MTVILSSADISAAKFGYHNLLDEALSVTASSEASGFEAANAYDWLLYDWWKPATTGTHYLTAAFGSAQSADYFAVFGHNLHTYGASVKLQSSTDGVNWTDRTSYQTPATGKVIFVSFTSASASHWRVVLYTTSGPASLGMVAFGTALAFPRALKPSFAPPTLARKNDVMGSQAEGGAFLGRSIVRHGSRFTIERDNLSPTWIREYWEPFMDHMETKPFFFSWDSENHQNEAAFCWTDGDDLKAEYHHPQYMKVSVPVVGLTKL